MNSKVRNFQQGYACAIACIIRGHGECTATTEALIAGGLTSYKELRTADIDPYDVEILKPSVLAIQRKNKQRSENL